MDKNNAFQSALGVLVLATVLVLVYPILHGAIPFLQNNFRTYDVLKPFRATTTVIDTSTAVTTDTLASSIDTIEAAPLPPQYHGIKHLQPFLHKMQQKQGQIRIAWYGDSAIEGDLICQTVRDSLQDLFGGEGIGFVPLVSHVEGFRQSIFQRATGDWYTWSLAKKDTTIRFPLSYQGTAFGHPLALDTTAIIPLFDTTFVAIDSTMRIDTSYQIKYKHIIATSEDSIAIADEIEPMTTFFAASKRYAHVMRLQPGFLYYGPVQYGGNPAKIKMQIGDTEKEIILNGQQRINRVALNTFACRSMTLTFEELNVQPLYGISFETPTGIIVDNLPARGNSGGLLRRISAQTFQEFDSTLGIDLVVLQYGLNAMNAEMTDYSWYKSEIRRVIRRIKEGYQNAAILLVGPTDKGEKIDGVMTSNPSVDIITPIFREVAEEEEIAFFSFYEAMGGQGSMVDWVENQNPPLATPDYTHLTFPGGRKAGDLLLDFLLNPPEEEEEKEAEVIN